MVSGGIGNGNDVVGLISKENAFLVGGAVMSSGFIGEEEFSSSQGRST